MTATHPMMTTVRMQLRSPWNAVAETCAIGQKLSTMLRYPAVSVVTATKTSGMIVTQA